jgi:hypothetical protein
MQPDSFAGKTCRLGWAQSYKEHLQEPPMSKLIQRFMFNEAGATAVEYGLIVAGISFAIITVAIRLAIK